MQYFQDVMSIENPSESELKAIDWIPEAMAFPAIDPDAIQTTEKHDEEGYAQAA